MNLFRSEEDARAWAHFDESSAESIMPVADWAYAFSAPLFRNRMEPDSFARMYEDGPTFFKRLAEKGKSGSFWH